MKEFAIVGGLVALVYVLYQMYMTSYTGANPFQ